MGNNVFMATWVPIHSICRAEEYWDRYYTEHPEELEDDDDADE